MHLFLIISVLLASLTLAQVNQCTGDKSIAGYCETLTYIDRTTSSPNPPTTANCQDTCRGILSDAGDWSVNFVGTYLFRFPYLRASLSPLCLFLTYLYVSNCDADTQQQANQTDTDKFYTTLHVDLAWVAHQVNLRTIGSICIIRTLWIFWMR